MYNTANFERTKPKQQSLFYLFQATLMCTIQNTKWNVCELSVLYIVQVFQNGQMLIEICTFSAQNLEEFNKYSLRFKMCFAKLAYGQNLILSYLSIFFKLT
jgi:hypothetical protein